MASATEWLAPEPAALAPVTLVYVTSSEENPEVPVDKAVELAKTAETEIVPILQIQRREAQSLKKYANDEGTSDKDAAIQLVHEGLVDKGYLTEDQD